VKCYERQSRPAQVNLKLPFQPSLYQFVGELQRSNTKVQSHYSRTLHCPGDDATFGLGDDPSVLQKSNQAISSMGT
jgi:hypothetical protein